MTIGSALLSGILQVNTVRAEQQAKLSQQHDQLTETLALADTSEHAVQAQLLLFQEDAKVLLIHCSVKLIADVSGIPHSGAQVFRGGESCSVMQHWCICLLISFSAVGSRGMLRSNGTIKHSYTLQLPLQQLSSVL